MKETEDVLTIKELMLKLHLSKMTIYNYMNQGLFPRPIKVSRAARWRVTDINKWITKNNDKANNNNKELKVKNQ